MESSGFAGVTVSWGFSDLTEKSQIVDISRNFGNIYIFYLIVFFCLISSKFNLYLISIFLNFKMFGVWGFGFALW